MSLTTPAEQQAHDERILVKSAQVQVHQARVDQQRRYRDSDSAYTRLSFDENEYERLAVELEGLERDLEALQQQYTGWPRYFHVQNVNGHVHTSTSCTSCYFDTAYAWRTDLSGLTPEQVVAQEAHNACSVCMPIAPVEQKAARQRYNAEQREAKQAERQAAKDAKYEKALMRARKHAAKVTAFIKSMTGEDDLSAALEVFNRDWSLYGHDGRHSVYNATYDMPAKVGDTLYFLAESKDQPGKRSLHEPNAAERQALTEAGLIAA